MPRLGGIQRSLNLSGNSQAKSEPFLATDLDMEQTLGGLYRPVVSKPPIPTPKKSGTHVGKHSLHNIDTREENLTTEDNNSQSTSSGQLNGKTNLHNGPNEKCKGIEQTSLDRRTFKSDVDLKEFHGLCNESIKSNGIQPKTPPKTAPKPVHIKMYQDNPPADAKFEQTRANGHTKDPSNGRETSDDESRAIDNGRGEHDVNNASSERQRSCGNGDYLDFPVFRKLQVHSEKTSPNTSLSGGQLNAGIQDGLVINRARLMDEIHEKDSKSNSFTEPCSHVLVTNELNSIVNSQNNVNGTRASSNNNERDKDRITGDSDTRKDGAHNGSKSAPSSPVKRSPVEAPSVATSTMQMKRASFDGRLPGLDLYDHSEEGGHPLFIGGRDVRDETSMMELKIVSSKGTVRGFKNRVRAGIATFIDQDKPQKSFKSMEIGRIVLYMTSMRIVRETYERCMRVKHILQTHMVEYEERDVFMSKENQTELKDRSLLDALKLPQVFADGILLGGADELDSMNESGDLRRIFTHFKKVTQPTSCEVCGGYRYIPCTTCHGSKKSLHRNHFTEEFTALRCIACDENGLIRCEKCHKETS